MVKWTTKDKKKVMEMCANGRTIRDIQRIVSHKSRGQILYLIQKEQDKANESLDKQKPSYSSLEKITNECALICEMLLTKNEQYGDSALNPIRIFSKADTTEQLKVRIDDKLNRLVQGNDSIESDEDVVKDLIGYLVLLLIDMKN